MENLKHIAILVSFFCIWLTSSIESEHEAFLSFFLILTFGILHGSNDIFLISRIRISEVAGPKKAINSDVWVICFYILFVLIASGLFYFAPALALLLFVVGSAYHFGEQHWENVFLPVEGVWRRIFYILYGMFVLSLLFWLNMESVIAIVETISGNNISRTAIGYLFYFNLTLLILTWIFFVLRSKIFRNNTLAEPIYLIVFAIIFKTSTLIWGFAIYFVFWHSLPSLYDQIYFLNKKVDKKGVMDYLKTAFPFWMISVLGILMLYYIFKDSDVFYALFFSFLAAITFPHSLAIHVMFKKKKSTDAQA